MAMNGPKPFEDPRVDRSGSDAYASDRSTVVVSTDASSGEIASLRRDPFPFFGIFLVLLIGAAGWNVVSRASSPVLLSAVVPATINAIFAMGVGFLIRQNGWVSFGHAAFFGLPAYVAGYAFNSGALPPEIALVASIVATGMTAFIIAVVIGRTSGVALSMVTLAIGQAFYEWSTKSRAVGGSDGMTVDMPASLFGLSGKLFVNRVSMFAVCWVTLFVVIIVLELVSRSPFGKLTEAIRDNDERIRFLGYRTLMPRALIFVLSACVTAIAGVLSLLNNGFVSSDTLHWSTSGTALIMALLGGVARVWGPILGAVAYILLRDYVGDATEHWQAIVGASLIVVIVAFPEGLSGLLLQTIARVSSVAGVLSRSKGRSA
jgi:branched-chain amino acid transport system permease protein